MASYVATIQEIQAKAQKEIEKIREKAIAELKEKQATVQQQLAEIEDQLEALGVVRAKKQKGEKRTRLPAPSLEQTLEKLGKKEVRLADFVTTMEEAGFSSTATKALVRENDEHFVVRSDPDHKGRGKPSLLLKRK